MIIRGTTPTHTWILPFESSLVKEARVIYAQNNKPIITKQTADCSIGEDKISVTLTQEETFLLNCDYYAEVQLRVLTIDGGVYNTSVRVEGVGKCLDSEVL
jgi:hypothetical protein